MTVVVDASVVVAAFVDSGEVGQWAAQQLGGGRLAAPHLMPVEVAGVLRRAELARYPSSDISALAHVDLLDLGVDLVPYVPFADRVWQLSHTVTAYDAWCVALAESLESTLFRLDRRLATAPGPKCRFGAPPL